MNYVSLIELLGKKQSGNLSIEEGWELIKLLEEAENEVRTWIYDYS